MNRRIKYTEVCDISLCNLFLDCSFNINLKHHWWLTTQIRSDSCPAGWSTVSSASSSNSSFFEYKTQQTTLYNNDLSAENWITLQWFNQTIAEDMRCYIYFIKQLEFRRQLTLYPQDSMWNCISGRGINFPQVIHAFFGILVNSAASNGSGVVSIFSCRGTMYITFFPLFDELLRTLAVYPSAPWGNGVVFLCPLPPLKT